MEVVLDIAREYFSGDTKPDRLEELSSYLEDVGIAQEHIRAKAMQLCGGDVAMFNRMATSCESTLRLLRKELERRPGSQDAAIASPSLAPK